MIMLELPPQLEQQIIVQAEQQNLSIQAYILSKLTPKNEQKSETLSEVFANVQLTNMQGDPVAIQQKLRDEWA